MNFISLVISLFIVFCYILKGTLQFAKEVRYSYMVLREADRKEDKSLSDEENSRYKFPLDISLIEDLLGRLF